MLSFIHCCLLLQFFIPSPSFYVMACEGVEVSCSGCAEELLRVTRVLASRSVGNIAIVGFKSPELPNPLFVLKQFFAFSFVGSFLSTQSELHESS